MTNLQTIKRIKQVAHLKAINFYRPEDKAYKQAVKVICRNKDWVTVKVKLTKKGIILSYKQYKLLQQLLSETGNILHDEDYCAEVIREQFK